MAQKCRKSPKDDRMMMMTTMVIAVVHHHSTKLHTTRALLKKQQQQEAAVFDVCWPDAWRPLCTVGDDPEELIIFDTTSDRFGSLSSRSASALQNRSFSLSVWKAIVSAIRLGVGRPAPISAVSTPET